MNLTIDHIKELNTGNVQVFNEIYNKMFHSLCLYGYKMISQEDIVSDIVQEVFIEFWKKKTQFSDPVKTKAYLYVAVRNKILTYLRNTRTVSLESNPQEEEEELNYHITKEETYKIIYQAIEKLPTQTGKVIELAIKGYGNPEIAEEMNVSLNTVKTLKKSAYKKLREMLKNNIFALMILTDLLS